jgi:hypothetical protein
MPLRTVWRNARYFTILAIARAAAMSYSCSYLALAISQSWDNGEENIRGAALDMKTCAHPGKPAWFFNVEELPAVEVH